MVTYDTGVITFAPFATHGTELAVVPASQVTSAHAMFLFHSIHVVCNWKSSQYFLLCLINVLNYLIVVNKVKLTSILINFIEHLYGFLAVMVAKRKRGREPIRNDHMYS